MSNATIARRVARLEARLRAGSESEQRMKMVEAPPEPVSMEDWQRQVDEYLEIKRQREQGLVVRRRIRGEPRDMIEWMLKREAKDSGRRS